MSAADATVASGLATPLAGDPGRAAVHGLVEAERPFVVTRVPRLAEASRPSEPAIAAASSDRMSPNRFSVTITS